MTKHITLEEARAYIMEYFTERRKRIVDGAELEEVCDICNAIEDKWCATLGLTLQELDAQVDTLLGWAEGRDHTLIDWLEGKGPMPSRDYVHPHSPPS
jgi:hypothetical protein